MAYGLDTQWKCKRKVTLPKLVQQMVLSIGCLVGGKVINIYTSSPANCPSAILIDPQKVTPQMPLLITNRSYPSLGVKEISFIVLMRLSLALPSSNKLFIFHGQSYNSLHPKRFTARTLAAMTLAFLTYSTLWLCHRKSPTSCLK